MPSWGIFPSTISFTVQPVISPYLGFAYSTFPSSSEMTMADGLCSMARSNFRSFSSSSFFRSVMSTKEVTVPTIFPRGSRRGAAFTVRMTRRPSLPETLHSTS
ncbi:MAG: hypothetical protein A3K53_12310 [Deltaproteobacteria bacterium RIFOXYB2_FULL_66_7]|nr:MAG: hypothetical protein A3K53_12310 [Deltaproteobacteria bacterium RIFOXYB2_FULL_66_7]